MPQFLYINEQLQPVKNEKEAFMRLSIKEDGRVNAYKKFAYADEYIEAFPNEPAYNWAKITDPEDFLKLSPKQPHKNNKTLQNILNGFPQPEPYWADQARKTITSLATTKTLNLEEDTLQTWADLIGRVLPGFLAQSKGNPLLTLEKEAKDMFYSGIYCPWGLPWKQMVKRIFGQYRKPIARFVADLSPVELYRIAPLAHWFTPDEWVRFLQENSPLKEKLAEQWFSVESMQQLAPYRSAWSYKTKRDLLLVSFNEEEEQLVYRISGVLKNLASTKPIQKRFRSIFELHQHILKLPATAFMEDRVVELPAQVESLAGLEVKRGEETLGFLTPLISPSDYLQAGEELCNCFAHKATIHLALNCEAFHFVLKNSEGRPLVALEVKPGRVKGNWKVGEVLGSYNEETPYRGDVQRTIYERLKRIELVLVSFEQAYKEELEGPALKSLLKIEGLFTLEEWGEVFRRVPKEELLRILESGEGHIGVHLMLPWVNFFDYETCYPPLKDG